jgi:hypothetical protein
MLYVTRRAASLALAFALMSGLAHGADAKPDLDLLDQYLDRADEARTEAEWTALSESGEEAVLARWESAMLSLADAGVDYAALKTEAASEIKGEVERRLSAWLMDRFFSSVGDADLAGLLNGMKRSTLAAVFELDGNGAIRLDAEGDPIRRDLTGDAAFETELGAWKASARGLENQAISEWETHSTEAFAELLADLSPGARANLEALGPARLADYGASLRREADAMLALEESNYRFLRLRDQYSLRLESEGESAESVVDGLVGKAQEALEAGLKNLADGLDAEVGAVAIDGRPIDGDEWQERFREELEKGLALWEKSGEDFIARRVEWEQRAGKDLASGIDEWNAALRELQEREGAWLDEFQSVRERAEAQYDRRFAEIDQAQRQAKAELDASVAANEGNLTERIEVTVGALNQSLEMMKTARESAGYWIAQTNGNADFSVDPLSWDADALRGALLSAMFACAGERLGAFGAESFSPSAIPDLANLARFLASIRASAGFQDYLDGEAALAPDAASIAALAKRCADEGTPGDCAAYRSAVEEFYRERLFGKAEELAQKAVDDSEGQLTDADRAALSGMLSALAGAALERVARSLTGSGDGSGEDAEAFGQAAYWIDSVYAKYAEEAEAQNAELSKSYGLVVFEGKDIPSVGYSSGQTIAGPIEALDAHGWEALYLDSYQVELLKARAVSEYWGKELAVAKAVYDYAIDESSGRPSEAETLEDYRSAYASYTAALAEYRGAVADLSAVNAALDEKNAVIAAIKARLCDAKDRLAEEKSRYADLLSLASLDSADYYAGQFRAYYEAIARLRGSGPESFSESVSRVATSGSTYASESFVKESSEALEKLIRGDASAESPTEGIADLKREYDARSSFTPDQSRFADGDFLARVAKDLGLSENDAWYATIERAYADFGGLSMDVQASRDFSRFLEGAAATLAAESAGTLKRRMMEAAVLLSGSEGDAYGAASRLVPSAGTVSSVADAASLLERGETSALFDLLSKRLDVELPALERLIAEIDAYRNDHGGSVAGFAADSPGSGTDAAGDLSWSLWRILATEQGLTGEGIASYAAECRNTLTEIKTIVTAIADVAERTRALRALASGNRLAMGYLNGNTVFSSHGVDYTIRYLADEYAATVALSGAAVAYKESAALSPGLQSAAKSEIMGELSSWVSGNRFGSVSGGSLALKSPVALWQDFSPASADDAVEKIAQVTQGAEPLLTDARMPAYLRQALSSWLGEVSTFFAYRARRDFGDSGDAQVSSLRSRAESLVTERAELAANSGDFLDASKPSTSRAVAALNLIASGVDLSAAVEDVALDALAASLCSDRLTLEGGASVSWESRYDAWFAGLKARDAGNERRDAVRESILARAESLWETAKVESESGYDYAASANKETLDGIKRIETLKACPPEEYLAAFEENGDAIANDAMALYRVETYLKTAVPGEAFGVNEAFARLYYGGDAALASAALSAEMARDSSEQKSAYGILLFLASGLGDPSATNVDAKAALRPFSVAYLSSSASSGTLIALANGDSGANEVYSGLYYASLNAALSEWSDDARLGALGTLMSATGIEANDSIDLDAFASSGADARALAGYACSDATYAYALKARVLSGADVNPYLEGASAEVKAELTRFRRIVSATYRYAACLDGPFATFLATISDDDLDAEERADAALFQALGWFRDPYFGESAPSAGMKGFVDSEAKSFAAGLSALARLSGGILAEEFGKRSDELSLTRARSEACAICSSSSGADDGSWRQYLGVEGVMTHEKDEGILDDTSLAYEPCVAVGDLQEEAGGKCVYYGADSAINGALESAQRLTGLSSALESWFGAWYASDVSASANAYLSENAALAEADPLTGPLAAAFWSFKGVSVSPAAASAFQRDYQGYCGYIGQQAALSKAMANLGETVVEFNANKNRSAAAMTSAAKGRITALQAEITSIEAEWAKAIDDPSVSVESLSEANYASAGYRQLEAAYSARYANAEGAFERLEAAKQASKTAQAIYDYASTPYLRPLASLSADDGADASAALKSVDPDTRLAEVRDHVRRASVAVSALESLYESDGQRKTLAERDPEYSRLITAYEHEYRNRLATMQARTLVESEIKDAQARYDKEKSAYENAVRSADNAEIAFSETDSDGVSTMNVHDWLTGLRDKLASDQLKKLFDGLRVSDGTVSFSDSGVMDESAILAYFTRAKGEGLSEFERDLAAWMERNAGVDVGLWSKALSWEEFRKAGGLTPEEYASAYPELPNQGWNQGHDAVARPSYGDLCLAAAKKTLLAEFGGNADDDDVDKAIRAFFDPWGGGVEGWIQGLKDAYDQVASSGDYDFFKMLALCNAAKFDSDAEAHSFLDSVAARDLYADAREICQQRGTNSAFNKPEWHNARDDAAALWVKADRLYVENNGFLNMKQSALADQARRVAEAKAALISLTGEDPEGDGGFVTFDGLIDAVEAASAHNASLPLDDILKTAGIANIPSMSAAEKALALRNVLFANGGITTTGAPAGMLATFDTLVAAHDNLADAAGESLSAYLRGPGTVGTTASLAVTQKKNEASYDGAYADFVARGIIPDSETNRNVLAGWMALIAANRANPATGAAAIANAAEEYLARTPEIEGEDRAFGNLRLALSAYRKAGTTGVGMASAAATLAETFSALASAYEAGAAYLDALGIAFDRRGETSGSDHVYDDRENAIRTHELYRGILGDLSDEKSSVRLTGLADVTESLKESLLSMNESRLSAYAEVRMGQWDILRQELSEEKAHYEAQLDAILSRGRYEWRKGKTALAAAQGSWEKSFERNFTVKENLWDDRYLAFLGKKEAWAKDLVAQAVCVGDRAILGRVPELTADYLRETEDFIVSDVVERPSPSCLIRDILDEDLLSGLLRGGKSLGGGVASFAPAVFQTLKRDSFTDADILDRVREYQTRNDDELQARLAYIQYDKALDSLKSARKEVEQSVADSNKSTRKSFRDMLLDDGFRQNGENFTKETAVGATLHDNLYETHTIKGFADFTTDVRDFTKDFAVPEGLSPQSIGMDSIQAILKKAMESVPKEYNRIYGERDKKGDWVNATYERQYLKDESYDDKKTWYDSASGKYVSFIVQKTRTVAASDATVTAETYKQYQEELAAIGADERSERENSGRILVRGNGLFNEWVGYAPVMKSDADVDVDIEDYEKNVRFAGSGETGRIMGMYIQHKMIEGAGQAEARQPSYNRRLWDDRGSWMAAPNLRSLSDIAMSIAAGIIAPGLGNLLLNVALNMIDDAVFMVMDMGNGLDAGSAFSTFAKKAATSVVTSRIGAGFSNAGGLLNSNMFGSGSGMVGTTLTKGLELTTENVASGAINSFSVRSLLEGDDFFDEGAFGESAFGKGAMASVVAGMAGNAVTTGLGKVNLTDANKDPLTKFTFDTANIQRYNTLMGSMVGSAVTYGLTGNAKLNVARFNDTGLMEMNLGKNGFSMNVGMNGSDISLGTISSAMRGYQEARKVRSWKFGSNEQLATLNAINMMGWTGECGNAQNVVVSQAIWSEKLKATFQDLPEGVNGYFDSNVNGNEIVLSSGFLGSGHESAAKLATDISHEGSHWSGNHIEGLAQEQGMMTYAQINAMFGLSADSQFEKTMVDAYKDPESWKVNESGREYWKLMDDGSIAYDGFATLRDERGNIIRSASSMGVKETQVEGGLIQILGLDKNNPEHIAAVQNMMKGSGMIMNAEGFWNKDGVVKTITQNGRSISLGMNLNKYNQDKTVSLGMIESLYKRLKVGKETYQGFIENNFKSAKIYLSMTGMSEKIAAEEIYGKAYSKKEQKMISYNLNHTLNVGKIVPGSTFTQNFEEQLTDYQLADGSLYSELHTGIDQQKIGGDAIYAPDGYWFVRSSGNGLLTLEQYGTGVRWRMAHLDPALVKKMDIGSSYSPGQKVIDYPDGFYGSTGGQNPHLHSEFTGVSNWKRVFLNPATWTSGNYSNYSWQKKNSQNQILSSGYFNSDF